MKVAIVSESLADEAAVRILVGAVLGDDVEALSLRPRSGGWQAVLNVLPAVLKALHYRREAEHLVVVLDSNHSPVHRGPAGEACESSEKCRLCIVRGLIRRVLAGVTPLPGLQGIQTAVGLAVPAIEAWYLCGKHPNVSENAWVQALGEHRRPYARNGLKELVYGTSRPSLAWETQRATEEMQRVVEDLGVLEGKFPVGFGALRGDLLHWSVARE